MRIVTRHGLDLTLLATVYRLVEAVEQGRLGLRATAEALDDAVRANHPYPRWVATAGSAGLAGRSRCCWARRGLRCWRRP